MASSLATKQDFRHFEQLLTSRMDALEGRIELKFQNLESRLLIKLGLLMTGLFSVAGVIAGLLR